MRRIDADLIRLIRVIRVLSLLCLHQLACLNLWWFDLAPALAAWLKERLPEAAKILLEESLH